MPTPIKDLDEILASLTVHERGDYVYALVDAVPADVEVLAAVWESEGLGVVVEASRAGRFGAEGEPVFTCLTLDVHSSLEAVGLTAAVATVLARAGISCNVVAGLHHDHLLVPRARADEAARLIRGLRTGA